MKDRTYEILKAKFRPELVTEAVPEENTQEDVQGGEIPSVAMEDYAVAVRKSFLESYGLDPANGHTWADKYVAIEVARRLERLLGVEMQRMGWQ